MPQLWAKGEYEFTSFGTIYFESKAYYDADCTLPHTTVVDPVPVHLYEPVTYQDLGEKMLQVGITGRGIFIEMTFDGERYPADAFFFTINQDSLYFSEVLVFEALRFGTEMYSSMDIDFETCLTRS